MNHTVFLGLGSNQGDRMANMMAAIDAIGGLGTVEAVSGFMESEPWGYESDSTYLNAALRLRTELEPLALLGATQEIERQLGRTQKTGSDRVYRDRPIDIDILTYDDLEISLPNLVIPHPLMRQRPFVMKPLGEIGF